MIRLDFAPSPEGERWAVISQGEHARISAELAGSCSGRFLAEGIVDASHWSTSAMDEVHAQVFVAILHHDDGWNEWERNPRLDPKSGRPLSYLEVTPDEATQIWTRSVESAHVYGSLAGATVAGHFLRLSGFADHLRGDPSTINWQREMSARRSEWIMDWQANNPELPAQALASRALEWLWTFDEISLWLCGDRPPGSGRTRAADNYVAGQGTPLEMELRVAVDGPADEFNGPPTATTASPWRFTSDRMQFVINGSVVISRPGTSSADLFSDARPIAFEETLRPG